MSWSLTWAFYRCQYHSESAQQTYFLWCPWRSQCRTELNYSFKLCAYFVPLTGSSTGSLSLEYKGWDWIFAEGSKVYGLCCREVASGFGFTSWGRDQIFCSMSLLECGSWMPSLSFPVGSVLERGILNLCHYVIAHHSFNSAMRCMCSYRAIVPCL